MKFEIKKRSGYFDLQITDGNTKIESTLIMDKKELLVEVRPILDEIIGCLGSEDHGWLMDSIGNELKRNGFEVVSRDEKTAYVDGLEKKNELLKNLILFNHPSLAAFDNRHSEIAGIQWREYCTEFPEEQ